MMEQWNSGIMGSDLWLGEDNAIAPKPHIFSAACRNFETLN
jgi:hypothetical protein